MGINEGRIKMMEDLYQEWRECLEKEEIDNLVLALDRLQKGTRLFVKIYYVDKDNYTIKFIDESGEKIHTIRKSNTKKAEIRARDCKWRERKYGDVQSKK